MKGDIWRICMLILAVLGIGYWQCWQYWVGLVRVVKGMVQVKCASAAAGTPCHCFCCRQLRQMWVLTNVKCCENRLRGRMCGRSRFCVVLQLRQPPN